MFEFFKNMWIMGRLTVKQLLHLVKLGRLTEDEAKVIEALERLRKQ